MSLVAVSAYAFLDYDSHRMNILMSLYQELMVPLSALLEWIESLQSWDEPFKTSAFLIVCSYIVVKYVYSRLKL